MAKREEFLKLFEKYWPALPLETREAVANFRDIVEKENESQNLTRLIEPEAFFEGHVIDVREFLAMDLKFPALDLGSGVGVPGLLSALIRKDPWILADSEGHKARFLERVAGELGVSGHIEVFAGRGEELLLKKRVETVVCRAVGAVERIMGWIGKCSTWNTLVLFKGPRWEEEWIAVQKTKWGKGLQIKSERRYDLPVSGAKRVIVELEYVPRGTLK